MCAIFYKGSSCAGERAFSVRQTLLLQPVRLQTAQKQTVLSRCDSRYRTERTAMAVLRWPYCYIYDSNDVNHAVITAYTTAGS
jgi:hypothetical protein